MTNYIEFTGNKLNQYAYTENFTCRMITLETTMKSRSTGKPEKVRVTMTQINNPKRNSKSYGCVLETEVYIDSVIDKFGNMHSSCANWEYYRMNICDKFDNSVDKLNKLYKKSFK